MLRLPALTPGWLVLRGTSSHQKALCCTSACPAARPGVRPLAGWRGTGPLGAACNCLCLKVWAIQAPGAEQQVRAKAENGRIQLLPFPPTVPHPPHVCFFFRPCFDCYSLLPAGNGTACRGSQAWLLRKAQHANSESHHPLGKGLLVWDYSSQAAPGRDECANPDGVEVCDATDTLAGGGLSWKEKMGGSR